MNFYLQGLDEIISGFLANTGKSVESIFIDSYLTELTLGNVIIKHEPIITYGSKKMVCWEIPHNDYPISIE
jgi:hypothetical protein